MKVACIFLTCDRLELTVRCINQNFFNAELNADVFLIDNGSELETFEAIKNAYPFTKVHRFENNKGIATAINKGIELAKGYDAVVTLANDILMPQGWLKAMVDQAKVLPAGMIGIHCVEGLPELKNGVHQSVTVFGNAMITRKAIDAVGLFNTDYDPYGMQDADYCYRLDKCGFTNYYLHGLRSEHIGHDVGNNTAYRKMKDKGLAKAQKVWNESMIIYEKNGYRI